MKNEHIYIYIYKYLWRWKYEKWTYIYIYIYINIYGDESIDLFCNEFSLYEFENDYQY